MMSANGTALLSVIMPAGDHDRGRNAMWEADNAYRATLRRLREELPGLA
jgi:hypothetical protein